MSDRLVTPIGKDLLATVKPEGRTYHLSVDTNGSNAQRVLGAVLMDNNRGNGVVVFGETVALKADTVQRAADAVLYLAGCLADPRGSVVVLGPVGEDHPLHPALAARGLAVDARDPSVARSELEAAWASTDAFPAELKIARREIAGGHIS